MRGRINKGHASTVFKCPIFRNHKQGNATRERQTTRNGNTNANRIQRPGNLSRTARKHANRTERRRLTARRRNIIMMMMGGGHCYWYSNPIESTEQSQRSPIDRQPLTWVRSPRMWHGTEWRVRNPESRIRTPATPYPQLGAYIVKRMSTLSTCLHPNLIPRWLPSPLALPFCFVLKDLLAISLAFTAQYAGAGDRRRSVGFWFWLLFDFRSTNVVHPARLVTFSQVSGTWGIWW